MLVGHWPHVEPAQGWSIAVLPSLVRRTGLVFHSPLHVLPKRQPPNLSSPFP